MRSSSSSELGPKIVQIETRYVQTDAVNFRDVVQNLTGKNSSMDWIGQRPDTVAAPGASLEIKGGSIKVEEVDNVNATSHSMLMTNMSFKDFERLLLELPPIQMEEVMMPWL